jgi:hypothetical protein
MDFLQHRANQAVLWLSFTGLSKPCMGEMSKAIGEMTKLPIAMAHSFQIYIMQKNQNCLFLLSKLLRHGVQFEVSNRRQLDNEVYQSSRWEMRQIPLQKDVTITRPHQKPILQWRPVLQS